MSSKDFCYNIFKLGEVDHTGKEFAYFGENPEGLYKRISTNLIYVDYKNSNVVKDIPYVLPGPDDRWAGNRKGTLCIHFGVENIKKEAIARLALNFVETNPHAVPRLKININGHQLFMEVPKGDNEHYFKDFRTSSKTKRSVVEFPASYFKENNFLIIEVESGSWVVFDNIQLDCTSPVKNVRCRSEISLIQASSLPALVYTDKEGVLAHPVKISVINWRNKSHRISWTYDGQKGGVLNLKPGLNNLELQIPEGKCMDSVQIVLGDIQDGNDIRTSILEPDKWTIYLVQHTHTDIGYTKPQTEILTEHLRYIDYVLDFCDATKMYPDDSKFRWTCESAWAVDEWLKIRPKEQVDKFLKYVQEGRIEVTAMYFNMSELSGENSFKTFLSPVKRFQEMGIPVKLAMQNDVNGVAWCLADYLPDLGIKFISMGSNADRAVIPFDKPTVYKWESPSGKSLLSYRSDMYHTANYWGIEKGDMDVFTNGLFSYISSLKARGYEYPCINVQYSGYFTDNAPPSMRECDLIRAWNEHYAWPKLRSAVASEFFEEISAKYQDELPIFRGAYPDWWTDGFGTAARETAASRKTQSDLVAIGGLLSMSHMLGYEKTQEANNELRRIHKSLLFYDEHTFGAKESIWDPLCENSQVQWAEKSSYVWEGLKSAQMLYETAAGSLQGNLYRSDHPTLTIFNPLCWERSELIKVYIDFDIIPEDRKYCIKDEQGNSLKVQELNSIREGRYYMIWAENIPSLGYKTFEIEIGEELKDSNPLMELKENSVENGFYRIKFDFQKGCITSCIDKDLNCELVDKESQWGLGEIIYERLNNGRALYPSTRVGMKNVRLRGVQNGQIYKSIFIEGNIDGCDNSGVKLEIRMYNDIKKIDFSYSFKRLPEFVPSGYYVSFPFGISNAKLAVDVPGGLMYSGENQIPGSASTWNTMQNFFLAENDTIQVVVSSDEIPLVMLGDLITENAFKKEKKYEFPHVFSWVMNNYWYTNFKASQEGELKWKYTMTSLSKGSNTDVFKFSWSNRIPLYARVVPASDKANDGAKIKSFLKLDNDNLLITSCVPSMEGDLSLLLNIREVNNKNEVISFKNEQGELIPFSIVNILDEEKSGLMKSYKMAPYENVFIRLRMY